jgi:uncharacterized protein with ATP-grasp and redox domains
MKYLIFNAEVNTENVQKLLDDITEDSVIYFQSGGGEYTIATYLIDFFNRAPHDITLVCNSIAGSCAFDILLMSNVKREIKESCVGVVHLASEEVLVRDLIKNDKENKMQMADLKQCNVTRGNFYKSIGMSKKDLALYYKGEDLFYDNKEMQRFSNNATKLYGGQ